MAEVAMSRPAIGRAELVGKDLGTDAVDAAREVAVGDGGVARLNAPHGLAQPAHRCRWVEDDFGAVDAVHHPVLRVVASEANIDGYSSELGLPTWNVRSTV